MTDEQPPEELEFIPWSELLSQHRAARPWMAYLLAGILAAAGFGALVARAVWKPAPPPVSVEVPSTVSPEPTGIESPPSPSALYREADLMAVGADRERGVAVVRAEWFVTDYFTADGDAGGSEQVRDALPEDGLLPSLPQDRPGPVSYVEWARGIDAELLEEGLYRVTVAFRTISGAEGSFRRLPVRAVTVVVGVAPSGGSAVLDLPMPARLPSSPATVAWPSGEDPAPEEVIRAAVARSEEWGEAPAVIASAAAETGWRVVVEVGDEGGRRWPLVLWMDGSVSLPAPPWLGRGPP